MTQAFKFHPALGPVPAACALALSMFLGGLQPALAAPPGPNAALGIADAGYSLDALIAAAKKEQPITVVDATGKILEMAKKFTEK